MAKAYFEIDYVDSSGREHTGQAQLHLAGFDPGRSLGQTIELTHDTARRDLGMSARDGFAIDGYDVEHDEYHRVMASSIAAVEPGGFRG